MLLDVAFGSKSAWRILSVMTEAPGRGFSMGEIAEATRLGGSSLSRTLALLVLHGLAEVNGRGRSKLYRLNLGHTQVKHIIALCERERKELNYLPWEIVSLLREYVRLVIEELPVNEVILFGSQARRTARKSSDIDIALILTRELETKEHIALTEITRELEKRFGVQIQSHPFTNRQFSQKEDTLVQEIQRDGINLVRASRPP